MMSRIDRASEFFHGEKRDNCAQSVVRAFADVFDLQEKDIQAHAHNGGGRAAGGVCGALVAACSLLPDRTEELTGDFSVQAGSALCREIRSAKTVSCRRCVEIAAGLVDNAVVNA